jgi:hypothetical protein
LRERYEGVKAAVLETSRKLGQERRRLAELERRGEAGDDRGEAESERRGRVDFFRTGNYIINMKRIDYVQRLENGLVRIYFSNKESTILSTEASKEFFQRFAPETR